MYNRGLSALMAAIATSSYERNLGLPSINSDYAIAQQRFKLLQELEIWQHSCGIMVLQNDDLHACDSDEHYRRQLLVTILYRRCLLLIDVPSIFRLMQAATREESISGHSVVTNIDMAVIIVPALQNATAFLTIIRHVSYDPSILDNTGIWWLCNYSGK